MSIALLNEASPHAAGSACRHASSPRECDEADRELRGLGEVTRLLLPEALPQVPSLDMAVSYRPKRQAGGDYYDFLRLPRGSWGVLVADVAGHGASAAIGMAVLHATVKAAPVQSSPAALMQYLNQQLAAGYSGRQGSFVTAAYATFDPAAGLLTYARAGHPAPRLRRRGRVLPLDDASGLPLGINHGETFDEFTITLQRHDALLLYTDGVTEARREGGEMFGTSRLDGAFFSPATSAAETVQRILESVESFGGGRGLRDDSTLVVVAGR